MKLTVAIKLLPTPEQAAILRATLERCNEAATWIAAVGFAADVKRKFDLQKIAYYEAREKFGIGAALAYSSIGRAADAFKTSRGRQPKFRPLASIRLKAEAVRLVGANLSIMVLSGRLVIPYVGTESQLHLLKVSRGEAHLALRRGKWFLLCPYDAVERPEIVPTDWLGVDLGIVNLAHDSDGTAYSGVEVDKKRAHATRRRGGLHKRKTKAAKRRMKRLSGKLKRFQAHTNHCISKALVANAERTGRGIALEDLKHIVERVTARRSQRGRLHNWSFGQLRQFISYKAKMRGIPVAIVDPRNTNRECSCCGHVSKANRTKQATFACVSCGHTEPADLNAARNIRARAALATPSSSRASVAGKAEQALLDRGVATIPQISETKHVMGP